MLFGNDTIEGIEGACALWGSSLGSSMGVMKELLASHHHFRMLARMLCCSAAKERKGERKEEKKTDSIFSLQIQYADFTLCPSSISRITHKDSSIVDMA